MNPTYLHWRLSKSWPHHIPVSPPVRECPALTHNPEGLHQSFIISSMKQDKDIHSLISLMTLEAVKNW